MPRRLPENYEKDPLCGAVDMKFEKIPDISTNNCDIVSHDMEVCIVVFGYIRLI